MQVRFSADPADIIDSMTACAQCGVPVVTYDHHFYVGSPKNPVRRFTIHGALYHFDFLSGPDHHDFCGALCATRWVDRRVLKPRYGRAHDPLTATGLIPWN